MLNPVFSAKLNREVSNYKLDKKYAELISNINESVSTGPELRLQQCFTDEIWTKLSYLKLDNLDWQNLRVLDLCAGTGFLSYHILSKVSPKELDLVDISPNEIELAKKLIKGVARKTKLGFFVDDILKFSTQQPYDIIIGNSFIHHLYDAEGGLKKLGNLLVSGGYFVTLHEPTPMAVALETGSYKQTFKSIAGRDTFINRLRPSDAVMALNPGGDVWLFKKNELANIFESAGYSVNHIEVFNFFRPLLVARKNLHLSINRKRLNSVDIQVFNRAINRDKLIKKFLPNDWFGSIALSACKK